MRHAIGHAILAVALVTGLATLPAQAGSLPVKGQFGNASVAIQNGKNNFASVAIAGEHNFTSVTQAGEGHTFTQTITGSNNNLAVIQMNSHNYEGTRSSVSVTPNGTATYIIQITPRPTD